MIYSFRNKNNDEIVTLEMMMAEREPFLKEWPEYEQIITKMHLADPLMLGILSKETKDFNKNVIGRMRQGIHGNNLKEQSRYGHNVTEL